MYKNKLVLECIKDVINESTGVRWFTKGKQYIGHVEEYKLFSYDDLNCKSYIAESRGGIWNSDEWFNEHFLENKKSSYEINKQYPER